MQWNNYLILKHLVFFPILLTALTFFFIPLAKAELEKGEKIYNRFCAECHATDGTGILAPPFVESSRFKSQEGVVALIDYIMPATRPDLCTGISAEDVSAFVIKKFKFKVPVKMIDAVTISDANGQKELFEQTCSVCHGVDGKGDIARPIMGSSLFKAKNDLVRFIDGLMPFHNPHKCKQACPDHAAQYIVDNFKLKIAAP